MIDDNKYGKIVSFIHKLIQESYKNQENLNLVDATCGNGYDTMFLCNIAGMTGHVTAFDIQIEAIEQTDKLLKENFGYINYKLINDSHEFIYKYITDNIDVCVFNLGYLPLSDKQIKTNGETTISAIYNLLPLLSKSGRIYIAAYITHDTGDENNKIFDFLSSLSNTQYNVLHIKLINKLNSPPEIFIIEKNA